MPSGNLGNGIDGARAGDTVSRRTFRRTVSRRNEWNVVWYKTRTETRDEHESVH